jgi:hypothetical protein
MTNPKPWTAEKVFCIGANKTGTTSIEAALRDLGYAMGSQPHAELLLPNYIAHDYKPIIDFALRFDAFQDVPFNLPFMYVVVDHYFPNAKFILTVRDNPQQWYGSLLKFHGDWLAGGGIPTVQMLKDCTYSYKGFMFDAQCRVIAGSETEPYDPDRLIDFYDTHNKNAKAYFRGSDKLLVVNLAEKGSYARMCSFLGREPVSAEFPLVRPE